jgi:hypothetical protein
MTHWSLSNVLFSFQLFVDFLLLFLLLNSSFNALWSDRMQGIISIFLYLLRLALYSKIWPILGKVPQAAEKTVYCLDVEWKILQTSVRSFWSMVWFSSRILYWFFCLDDLSIGDNVVLKSSTTTICAFKSFRVCLMKLGSLTLGARKLIIITIVDNYNNTFWCIAPFISMKCPSLSCLINVSLKSTLSKCCYSCLFSGAIGFQPFTISQCLFLSMRWVSVNNRLLDLPF